MPAVMDAARVERTLARIAHEILERHRDLDDVVFVGHSVSSVIGVLAANRGLSQLPAAIRMFNLL
ncbi:MAG: hypothetical protein ACLGHP_08450, partial [Vicinamibacteria bacterium]